MTNVVLVARKLALLEDHLRRIEVRRPKEVEPFTSDLLLQDAVSMSVLVIVQETIDVALHIASDEGWETAATYREAFVVLERHGVIDGALALSLAGSAQLRNRIAHGYASLDAVRLWTELPAGMASWEAFLAAVSTFVAMEPAPPTRE